MIYTIIILVYTIYTIYRGNDCDASSSVKRCCNKTLTNVTYINIILMWNRHVKYAIAIANLRSTSHAKTKSSSPFVSWSYNLTINVKWCYIMPYIYSACVCQKVLVYIIDILEIIRFYVFVSDGFPDAQHHLGQVS